eukprot:gene8439-8623_t
MQTGGYVSAAGGYRDVLLYSRLAPSVIRALPNFGPQDLSEVLWAYATAKVPYKALFAAAAPAAQQLLPGFTPQGLINVLWAYAVTQFSVPQDLLDATGAECLRRQNLAAFGPLNLSMLVWAHAKSNAILPPSLASAISRAVLATLADFAPTNLCRLLGGLAVLCCVDSQLLAASEPLILEWIEAGNVNVQDLCHGVWAFAAARSPTADRLIEPLLQLAAQHVGVLTRSGDSCARLSSTLVLLRYRADDFRFLDHVPNNRPSGTTGSSSSSAAVHYTQVSRNLRQQAMSRPLMAQALQLWQTELVPAVTPSQLQHEVACELTALKLKPVTEGLTPDGMFSVDILLRYKGYDVALEVMGVEHYSSNQKSEHGHLLLGSDQLRLRLLAARGYRLVIVNNYDWEAVRDQPGALRQLLRQKLEEAVEHSNCAGTAQPPAATQSQRLHNAAAAVEARAGTTLADSREATQQQPEASDQQLRRLLSQKGHTQNVQKRQQLLRRQHYMQQKRQTQAAGLEVLLHAAQLDGTLPVAKDRSSSSSTTTTTTPRRRRRLTAEGKQQPQERLTPPLVATADGQDAAAAGADASWSADHEFDMELVLDDLLLPADVDGQ